MRIKLTLHHSTKQIIPIDYRYYLSSWIYRTIYRSDRGFASWLHDKGYDAGRKKFKLFCYSDLYQSGSKLSGDRSGIIFSGNQANLILSFYVDEAVKHFIKGVFKDQHLEIAGKGHKGVFQISGVEILQSPEFSAVMTYEAISPIMIKQFREADKGVDHIGPVDSDYGTLLLENLKSKYKAYYGNPYSGNPSINLELAPGTISTKKHNIYLSGQRPVENKGYKYSFTFKAPVDFQRLGYFAGFGNSNSSLGYGMVEVHDH